MQDVAPIYFQFEDKKAAYQALDTLLELEYNVHLLDHAHPEHKPTLQVFVDRNDLTSALEIAQAHGGSLLETYEAGDESSLYSSAYGMEGVPSIPAHVVTEDLSESYMRGGTGDDEKEQDLLSGDDYDHFPAGIHM